MHASMHVGVNVRVRVLLILSECLHGLMAGVQFLGVHVPYVVSISMVATILVAASILYD